jgi:hypothetical protein
MPEEIDYEPALTPPAPPTNHRIVRSAPDDARLVAVELIDVGLRELERFIEDERDHGAHARLAPGAVVAGFPQGDLDSPGGRYNNHLVPDRIV